MARAWASNVREAIDPPRAAVRSSGRSPRRRALQRWSRPAIEAGAADKCMCRVRISVTGLSRFPVLAELRTSMQLPQRASKPISADIFNGRAYGNLSKASWSHSVGATVRGVKQLGQQARRPSQEG